MTPKISLITVIAIAALVAVPSAFGEGRLAGSKEPALATPDPMIEDGFAQAVAASLALQSGSAHVGSTLGTYLEAGQRAVPPTSPVAIAPTSSDRDIEWPQIGAGLGIGIVLAFGLVLALRLGRGRQLAHG